MLALVESVALAQNQKDPETCNTGQPCASEEKVQGSADDPNAWGAVVSELGIEGVVGEHSSDPPGDEPRDGLGNVARNDGGDEGTTDPENTGDHLGDHACIADDPFDTDCTADPGGTAPGRA